MNINYKYLYIKKILNDNKKIYLNINNKKKYVKNNNKLITIDNYLKKGGSDKNSLFKNLHKKTLSSIKKNSQVNQMSVIEKELKKRKEKEEKKYLNEIDKKISKLHL